MSFDLGLGPAFGALFWLSLIVVSDCDLMMRRVPNLVNAAIALLGCSAQLYAHGLSGLTAAGLGLAAGFGLILIPFALRLYRGGDAKFVMALGVWLGAKATLWMFLLGMVLGGLGALMMLLWRRLHATSKAGDPKADELIVDDPTADARCAEASSQPTSMQMVPMAVPFSLSAAWAALSFL